MSDMMSLACSACGKMAYRGKTCGRCGYMIPNDILITRIFDKSKVVGKATLLGGTDFDPTWQKIETAVYKDRDGKYTIVELSIVPLWGPPESEPPRDDVVDTEAIRQEIAGFEATHGITSEEFLSMRAQGKTEHIPHASVWASLLRAQLEPSEDA